MNNDYKICSKTVMDSSCPGTSFDKDGISNHYWEFINYVKPNWHLNDMGRKIFESQIIHIKDQGKNKDFDCIIGLSGGADSSFMLHKMVSEHGLRPLVFHVDGGWNSELAVHNINCLIDKLDLDLYTEVINWEEMKNFQLAMFKSGVPHLDTPQDLAFIGVLYKFASKYKIKYILNGGNISTECVQPPLELLYWGSDMVHNKDILKRFGSIPMTTYPFTDIFYHKFYLKYLRGIKVFKPLNYLPYIKEDAFRELETEYGWKPYPQKHFESRFTKFFEGYWLPERFGYDMRRNQFSSLILTEQMTREHALELLKSPSYNQDTIDDDFNYIASKLGIEVDELNKFLQMPKKFYWDYKNRHQIFSFGEKFASRFLNTRRGGAY